MKILAIDTSTDETSAAVTDGTKILSNVVWSQASLHAEWGGVVPSLAQREHAKRIDWVVNRAIRNSKLEISNLDDIAVTAGPGLAIALGVGINKAKELAKQHNKPLVAINHLEAHLLSPVARPKSLQYQVSGIQYPAFGLVVSGGNTLLVLIEKIGQYQVLADTRDDALGEALDKAARMLGLGYPGGAVLEKMAKAGNPQTYPLPLPMSGQENARAFSYSGLKTAMYRLVEGIKLEHQNLTKEDIQNLAASFQDRAFEHLVRVARYCMLHNSQFLIHDFLIGGGVSANVELRKRLRKLGKEFGIKVYFPYNKALCGDNAAMIGIAAYFKLERSMSPFVGAGADKIDREPRAKVNEKFSFEK